MMSYKSSFFSPFCLPSGKADDTPISGACAPQARCQGLAVDYGFPRKAKLRPWTPWVWGILNFRSIRVTLFYAHCSGKILVLIAGFGVIINRDRAIFMFGQHKCIALKLRKVARARMLLDITLCR